MPISSETAKTPSGKTEPNPIGVSELLSRTLASTRKRISGKAMTISVSRAMPASVQPPK